MTSTRREFVIASGAALAASRLPAQAGPAGDSAAEALLAEISEELMVDYSESASMLGIDNGACAAFKRADVTRSRFGSASSRL